MAGARAILAQKLGARQPTKLGCLADKPTGKREERRGVVDTPAIIVSAGLNTSSRAMAEKALSLAGLDKPLNQVIDSNGQLVAIDRVAQRMEVWLIAQVSKGDLRANPDDAFRRQIARTATGHGFFSIWMTVFEDDPTVRKLLIDEFTRTSADCFEIHTTRIVSPRPPNGLADGSKL